DGDVAARAGAVLHDDLLAEQVAERRRDDARRGIGAAAGLEADDRADRLGRPRLAKNRLRKQNEENRDQVFHGVLFSREPRPRASPPAPISSLRPARTWWRTRASPGSRLRRARRAHRAPADPASRG